MIRSIFSKILTSHIIIILVTTFTMGILMSFLIRNYVVESRKTELIQKGTSIVNILGPIMQIDRLGGNLEGISLLIGANTWLMDSTGNVLAGKAPDRWLRRQLESPSEIRPVFSGEIQSWVRTGRRQADPSVVVAIPVPNSAPPAALFLYTPITGVTKAADAVEKLLGFSLLVGMVAALLIAYLISRSLTRPIRNIISSAESFAKGNFLARTSAIGLDEVGLLGRTFNTMAASIACVEQNRREFLANVSHELKTPVASIQALAESLADGIVKDPDQQKRYLRNIVTETGRIDRLIRDLLDMSQLDAGEIALRPQNINMSDFVEKFIENHQHLFQERTIKVNINCPTGLKHAIADPDRLNQLLTNLLSNATRHSPDNSVITINIYEESGHICLAVVDQGAGIPAADLPYIFDRFYRVEKSRVRSDGGTGLGLAICKKIITAMNGEISVHSEEGYGSIFTITLPIA